MHPVIGGGSNYDRFSEDSAVEISERLEATGHGGETCMADFNSTTTLPHSEYVCDAQGFCYKKEHTHDDGAAFFMVAFFLYFLFLAFLLAWPLSYDYYQ